MSSNQELPEQRHDDRNDQQRRPQSPGIKDRFSCQSIIFHGFFLLLSKVY
jgi:hypothetical protein